MRKWPLIVAALYGLVLVLLFVPLGWVAFLPGWRQLGRMAGFMAAWQFWLIIVTLVVAQWVLLRVPVALVSGRPVRQRSVRATVAAATLMLALLAFGATLSIIEFCTRLEGAIGFPHAAAVAALAWLGWALYFRRCLKREPAAAGVARLQRFLWTGSILELLIAIPTHIVARHRDYCCAGLLTFLGLACGVSVMLFAFGPALLVLFVDRWKRLHPGRDC